MLDNSIVIYETDNNVNVEAYLENENIWLNQEQISKLYNKSKSTISEHIKNIIEEQELDKNAVVRNFRITAKDGKSYNTNYYNLEMIIAIGFRVKSNQGTKFRVWANEKLKDYLIKGYNINEERFKNNGNDPYFEELLDKIRGIRSSEKVFWRKILDIYSTAIDYNPKNEITVKFFKTVQNKMHYAVSNNTAAEIVYLRVDSNKDNIGLINFKEKFLRKKKQKLLRII